MNNLYFIVMKHSAGDFVLTRTAAKSAKQSWDRAIERYAASCEAKDRAGIIKELKKKEGWYAAKTSVPFNIGS